jgi:hypothetical protein
MPSTNPKPELTAKASMAQPVSQPAVYANGLTYSSRHIEYVLPFPDTFSSSGILPTEVCFILNAQKITTFAYTEDLECYKKLILFIQKDCAS